MSINEMFILATRQKFRFPFKGVATVEDLWDLNLTDLDGIYKALKAQKKQNDEESLLATKSKEDKVLDAKIEIIKYIVTEKQAEAEQRRTRAEQRKKRMRIAEILADKEVEALRDKSIDELTKMLEDMDE